MDREASAASSSLRPAPKAVARRGSSTPILADDVWIIIPAFSEEAVVGDVVRAVRRRYQNVVVVDDCSNDRTAECAEMAGARVLRHVVNLGQGAALQTGLTYALSRGAQYLVTFDADGQHRVEDVDVLLAEQRRSQADLVVGSRFLGGVEGIPRPRLLMLKLAVWFTRVTTGLELTDAHNGLRLLTRTAASSLRIYQNRMAHASEILEQAKSRELSVREAPVTILYTPYSLAKGQSIGNAFSILFELMIPRLKR